MAFLEVAKFRDCKKLINEPSRAAKPQKFLSNSQYFHLF
jgi:hypothetical protein